MRLFLLAATCAVCAAADPNFTGLWRLDADSSDIRALPVQPGKLLKVVHEGGAVRLRELEPEGPEWAFTTDRKEIRSGAYSAIGKWEGDAALVSVLISGAGYSLMDRWKLSRGGARLTIRREIADRGRTREALLVYIRDDLPAQPQPRPQQPKTALAEYRIEKGTRIPLVVINSVSTKQSASGDRIYLQTAFPIVVQGRVVIPPGSYVTGTLTYVKRPGRVHGRGELFLRFDSLTLPNGVTRDFRARPGAADSEIKGEVDRKEGNIRSEGDRAGDAQTIGGAAAAGASVGTIAGAAGGRPGMGAAIGGAAGAAAGVMGVLLSRGPDLVLARGATIEMVLDRPISFTAAELAP